MLYYIITYDEKVTSFHSK